MPPPSTSYNTSPSEDLVYRCWTLLQDLGHQLSRISNGIFISMNCWRSYANSTIAQGHPINTLLFSLQFHFAVQTVLTHGQRTLLKRTTDLNSQLHVVSPPIFFPLSLDLSLILLSRHQPSFGEKLCSLECESERRTPQNNDASTLGNICQKLRMSFGLLLRSRLIFAA